jgi:hypothetical protein
MHERAGEAPRRVETGALDDRRHLLRQYAVAVLGWAATVGVVLWLVLDATGPAVKVTFFLLTVCVVVAFVGVLVAVEAFRAPLIGERARPLPRPQMEPEVDALGRRVVVPEPDELDGELTIDTTDGLRRYRAVEP